MICMKMNLYVQHIFSSHERFRTEIRFNTEAKGNSDMTYCTKIQYLLRVVLPNFFFFFFFLGGGGGVLLLLGWLYTLI